MSVRQAADKYGVPKSSIQRWVSSAKDSPPKKSGGQISLSSREEDLIVNNLVTASEWGFPLTSMDIRVIVKQYLDRLGKRVKKFNNNLPGQDWIVSFLKTPKQILSERCCMNIKKVRAGIDQTMMQEYFSELEKSLDGISPEAIINYDETNITDDPGVKRVIGRRGSKHVYRIMDSSKSSISVMFCGTASGELLLPYVVYGESHVYDTWRQGGSKGALYGCSKTSSFNEIIFSDWFEGIILPYVKKLPKEVPKAVTGDNLSSHISINVLQKCREHNIKFILLPPNSTHLCQPLDVAYFRPLKAEWCKVLEEWKLKNRGPIMKDKFPAALKKTLNIMNYNNQTRHNIKARFKKTGIFPFDSQQVLKLIPKTTENEGDSQTLDNKFRTFLHELFRK
ncbi:uncharacterized protein LOC126443409 [Schistocerca serialis cubense]|uniref:uncharacterized protein LOC126443409 n=1 Tax=Schistocerca serialis cubense TaxID=2023355 RepID=UPI00214E5240|nr:uncharacterized protein LOC126443409 [Schistocerca serialis cubense]